MSQEKNDINTAEGMLRELLVVNSHGVWFVKVEETYRPLPRWMWGHCKRALPDPVVLPPAGEK